MNKEYINNNKKFLFINAISKRSQSRALYKSNKVKKIWDVSKSTKHMFYKSQEWTDLKDWMYSNYENICFSCGSKSELQIDHIKPISHYPSKCLDYRNLQILCINCNKIKSNKTSRKFKKSIHKLETYEISEKVKILRNGSNWLSFFSHNSI